MRILTGILSVAAVCMVLGSSAKADDLADLKARYAELSAQMAPAGGGDCESLTSLRQKGAVKIGGAIELDIGVIRRDEANNDSDDFDRTEFRTSDVDLDIRVDMTSDAYLFIKLDTDDLLFDDGMTKDGRDLLEEVNFTWKNVRGSNWTIILGKDEMPFGNDFDKVISDPYTHNDGTGSYLGTNYVDGDNVISNPHARSSVATFSHPGEIDNVFGVQAHYAYKDLAKLELAVFQNADLDDQGSRMGMHEDNSEDSMLFRSGAVRVWLMPVEGLKMQLSFANQHMDYMDDDTQAGRGGDEDKYALSFGANYKMKDLPLEFYGEYIHGWNQAYVDDFDTNTLQLGVVWGVTEKIDLVLDGEWLQLDNDNIVGGDDEDFYRVAIGATYKTDYGVNFLVEYMHEWYDNDIRNWDDTDADVFSFRTAYTF